MELGLGWSLCFTIEAVTEMKWAFVHDQGTIAGSFCDGNPHQITLDYRSELFFAHFNAEQFLHPITVDGRQLYEVSEGEVSSTPAIVHFNGLYPGDGKRQLLQKFRSG